MRIFAIDDEPKMLRTLQEAITEAEPEADILAFSSAAEVLEALSDPEKLPDVVFSDIEMPGMNGLTLAIKIKEAAPNARIVFVTGYDQYALEAYRLHVHGYVMKPVDAAAIREELDQIPQLPGPKPQTLYVQCFGFFEVFWQGKPLLFRRRRTKELLAFLVDRKGATCTAEEIAATLWEGETDLGKAKHQIRNLVSDLRATLRGIGMGELLIRKSGVLAIHAEQIDCDYYQMLSGSPDALNAFQGNYMTQYSWAEMTLGKLWFEYRRGDDSRFKTSQREFP